MIKVRVKGEGVKLANKWCYINDEAIIDEEEYERNKEYVDVIERIEEPEIPEEKTPEVDPGENQNPEGEKNPEDEVDDTNVEDNDGENPEEEPGEEKEDDDEELEALKARAKELNIKVTANMKKETIINKIEEAEKEAGENQNPEGE